MLFCHYDTLFRMKDSLSSPDVKYALKISGFVIPQMKTSNIAFYIPPPPKDIVIILLEFTLECSLNLVPDILSGILALYFLFNGDVFFVLGLSHNL